MKYSPALTEWFTALTSALTQETFVKLALTKPTPAAADLKSIDIRPILIKRELKLSFTYHYKTRDIVKNHTPAEAQPLLAKLLDTTFLAARMFTLEADHLIAKQGKTHILTHHGATQTTKPSLTHDRPKNRPLEAEGKPYLHALGLTDSSGNVLKSAQDKFRQINKYIEILDTLIRNLPTRPDVFKVADMGSGKGYLTFALYDHLTTTLNLKAEVIGVEFRPDMVKLCNSIATASGFTGLKFVQGTIADYDCTGTNLVMALHACDTATDDALHKAIRATADLIVVAPCCHKQIRRQLKAPTTHPLHPMLRFGTYAERMAEMVTDTLRTQLLELSGYTTNLFEFVAGDHTPKNVMIVATRQPTPLSPEAASQLRSTIAATKSYFGIQSHQLEKLLTS